MELRLAWTLFWRPTIFGGVNIVPSIVAQPELDELSELVSQHIEATGESVKSLSARTGVRRSVLSAIRNGNYTSSPSLETASRIGKRVVWVDAPHASED